MNNSNIAASSQAVHSPVQSIVFPGEIEQPMHEVALTGFGFASLGLAPSLLKMLEQLGYDEPTPIQRDAIPLVLEGRDVLGLAQTGTGKTAAFGLPLVQRLMEDGTRADKRAVRSLILAPTRELANQIAENMRAFTKHLSLSVQTIVGGASLQNQIRAANRGTDIMVATPGRLIDLMKRNAIRLDTARFLVLDEADQMLDLGFIHSLRQIAKALGPVRQTMLFSATMPKQIAELAATYLNDPVRVQVSPPGKAADKVRQFVHHVEQRAKNDKLKSLLADHMDERAIVFARTKHGAEKLMKSLVADGFSAGSVHGNKSQGQRDRAIKAFKAGDIMVLVATDVAARGLDIPDVKYVYNYELPEVAENYIHRIGRTARAGNDGIAVAFCGEHELKYLKDIERLMKITITVSSGERQESSGASRPARAKNEGRNGNSGERFAGKPAYKQAGQEKFRKDRRFAGGEGQGDKRKYNPLESRDGGESNREVSETENRGRPARAEGYGNKNRRPRADGNAQPRNENQQDRQNDRRKDFAPAADGNRREHFGRVRNEGAKDTQGQARPRQENGHEGRKPGQHESRHGARASANEHGNNGERRSFSAKSGGKPAGRDFAEHEGGNAAARPAPAKANKPRWDNARKSARAASNAAANSVGNPSGNPSGRPAGKGFGKPGGKNFSKAGAKPGFGNFSKAGGKPSGKASGKPSGKPGRAYA